MNDAPPREDATPAITLNRLAWRDPLHWLVLGARDFVRCPAIGVFYGGCFVVMGWALMKVARMPATPSDWSLAQEAWSFSAVRPSAL